VLSPWHSGIPHIYVAKARRGVDFATVGFVPGEIPLAEAAQLLNGATDTRELRDALGGRIHDEAVANRCTGSTGSRKSWPAASASPSRFARPFSRQTAERRSEPEKR